VTAWLATLALIARRHRRRMLDDTGIRLDGPVRASAAPSPSTVASIQPPTPIASIAVTAATASAPRFGRMHRRPHRCRPRAAIRSPGSSGRTPGATAVPTVRGCREPITVGAGEPLTVVLAGDAAVADWSAARVAPADQGRRGRDPLASADGDPIRFLAPEAGRWSVQVQVRFHGGSDSAAYYWLLDVR
jgi:hypothetical protein